MPNHEKAQGEQSYQKEDQILTIQTPRQDAEGKSLKSLKKTQILEDSNLKSDPLQMKSRISTTLQPLENPPEKASINMQSDRRS